MQCKVSYHASYDQFLPDSSEASLKREIMVSLESTSVCSYAWSHLVTTKPVKGCLPGEKFQLGAEAQNLSSGEN